mmetsp:Transcript_5106/g.7402  ORF Transcript_5106/g.7402 Transcript_5106/m.7402 type:complete len:271 (+) Transcript_5106:128-940(+)
MLCKMENGADYGEVLKEAQDLGYAEADPTADVEGHDVRAKICLLAKLAYGVTVDPDQVPCQGISSITSIDFEYAKLLGCTIKLIGTAKRLAQNTEYDGPICVFVAPTMVSLTDSLASIRSSGNAVAVTSQNMGTCLYCGPGAGRFPTANSIVADIYRVARQQAPPEPFPPVVSTTSTPLEIDPNFTSPFYIRIPFQDEIGIIQRIGALATLHQISIYSIQQNPIVDRMAADFVLITEEAEHAAVEKFCADLQEETFCRAPPLAMPLLKKL